MATEPLRVSVDGAEIVWPEPRRHAYAAHWGTADAETWLPVAVQQVEQLCRRWRLVPLAPAGEGVQSLVLHAATPSGTPVVLKVPRSPDVGAREHAALAEWAGGPVPRVEAHDPATGALLLEQLDEVPTGYTPADLVRVTRRLHVAPPLGTDPVEKTCRMLLRSARDHHAGRATERRHHADLVVAEKLMSTLADVGERALLHGDLLHKNLLTTTAGLHAIDPQPVAGPAELELARWVAWGGADHVTGFDLLVAELLAADAADGHGGDRLDPDRLTTWTWAVSVCENRPGRAGERARLSFLERHRSRWRRVT